MKVLLCTSFLHPRGGDTTCYFAQWRGLERRGYTVIPFAMRHPENLPSTWEVRFPPRVDPHGARGVARLLEAARAIHSPAAARAVAELVRDHRPDIAHVHHLHRHLTPSILGPLRAAGIPVVMTAHDYELVCPNGQIWTNGARCTRCAGHRYTEAVRQRCKRGDTAQSVAVAIEKKVHASLGVWERLDRILCPSRFLRDTLATFGLPAERLVHLPNPVEPGPAGGAPGVGWAFAGRIAPEKGVDVLLTAARLLPHRVLDVYGDGPERAARARTAPPNVRFHGAVPPERLAEALRATGVVAVPSRWPENQPYAVLEAQLAGRAVVASAVGGIPELVTDGVDGRLVPPDAPEALAAAVDALLGDPVTATRLGAAGRARVLRDGDPDLHLDRLEATYQSVRRE